MTEETSSKGRHQPGLRKDQMNLLKGMFDQAPILMAVTEGPDHRVIYLNPSFRQVLGGREFPPGTPAADLLPDLKAEDETEVQDSIQRFNRAYTTGEPFIANEFKTLYDRTRDGKLEKAYFNWIYQPLKDSSGNVYGLFIAGYEVTGHVEARQEREYSEQRLRLALEGSNIGFWEIDIPSSSTVYASDHCKEHFGYSRDEDVSFDDFMEAVHPEDRERLAASTEEMIETIQSSTSEYRVLWPDGSLHWLMSRGQCLFNEEGRPYRLIGITEDITQHKQAEQKLKEAVKLRDNFLSIAAHELQTPVTSVKIQAELFERRLHDDGFENQASQAEKISRQIDHLSQLTNRLLDMSRMQKQGLSLEKDYFSLDELIEETVEALSHVSEHTIEVEGRAIGAVCADRSRINQVLTNLIENAIKYSPKADRIVVHCREEAERIVISVTDFGVGIPPEERLRVFERFYKGGNDGRQTYPGFGIGLYVSRQIIERHGGGIWVDDNPEGGSVFSFSLPVSSPKGNSH